ncbi:hypothetical protein ACEPAI_3467 [Sanghuangporus weigelae]
MPIFDELHAFCQPEDAPEWTFTLRPPTERYQWPQLCNRFNEENYEDEIVPLCPGKYFDDLFDKWNAIHHNRDEIPHLMMANHSDEWLFKLSNPRDAALRRLNDDAFLTYAIELETQALHRGKINFRHETTYKNIMGIYHSAIQICAYRRDMTTAILNRMMRWSHYHPMSIDAMKYIIYIADQTGFYASHTMQFMTVLNMTKYYEGTRYRTVIEARNATTDELPLDAIEHHVVEGKEVNYDPHYLMELNNREEEAREKLQATRHPLLEDLMISVYQYPNELYQPDEMLTMSEQEDMYIHSDDTESSEEGESRELYTPANSAQTTPEAEESEDL